MQHLAARRARQRIIGPAATSATLLAVGVWSCPAAVADNSRFNNSVVADVYTVQKQAGCPSGVKNNPKLQLAAQWHAKDVLDNRQLDADTGSDGTTVTQRAQNAGYRGMVAETVAINPALAISGIELINNWYYRPDDYGIMSDCGNTDIGVWSDNSLDRTVVVAVYGKGDAASLERGRR